MSDTPLPKGPEEDPEVVAHNDELEEEEDPCGTLIVKCTTYG